MFKLRRLKSSLKLQKFYPKCDNQVQRCSVCHGIGHNKRNPLCPGPPEIENTARVEEDVVEEREEDLGNPPFGSENDEAEETSEESAESVQNFFIFHFVDETLVDDD